MVINTNVASLQSAQLLQQSESQLSNSLAELSSGSKIVSPADDPAGMAVSMRLNAQIQNAGAANDNVGDAISFSQTQDGYLQSIGSALTQMSQLAVQAQDVTKSSTDLGQYNTEFQALAGYITDLSEKQFNGTNLFDGTQWQITTDPEAGIANGNGSDGLFTMGGVDATGNNGFQVSSVDVNSNGDAVDALAAVNTALNNLGTARATVGSNMEILNSYSSTLSTLSDNLSAANSSIADVDVATESANYAKYNILVQSGTAMLAQANQMPQSVLKLLS